MVVKKAELKGWKLVAKKVAKKVELMVV